MISRRSFIALASGLLVPEVEPVRAYSFIGGWNPVVAHITLDGRRILEVTERMTRGVVNVQLRYGRALGITVVEPERFRSFPLHVSTLEVGSYPGASWAMDAVPRNWAVSA
jgi:hypothetical protein